MRKIEIGRIRRGLENKIVAEKLESNGLSKEEALSKIDQMRDEQLHQIAALQTKYQHSGTFSDNSISFPNANVSHHIEWTWKAMCFILKKFLIFTLIIISIPFVSCAERGSVYENDPGSGGERIIENVPFVRQKDFFCGPAAIASVMRLYGRNISQEEVAKVVYTPKLNGALISDMENYAREMGYKAETKNGDLNLLMSLIDEGVPAITLVDLGKWIISQPHYYVVFGYDKSRKVFFLHTGFAKDQEISFSRLDKEWEKMDRLVLIIRE